jgi:hypothetical protein
MSREPKLKSGEEAIEDETIITCWCGEKGTYEQLFQDHGDSSCGGSGTITCYCGGDLCVCHNHGYFECPGCPDCEDDDDGAAQNNADAEDFDKAYDDALGDFQEDAE